MTGATPRADEDFSALFFQLSSDLLCILSLDEGTFRTLNPAWERILGFPIGELLGQPLLAFVHPDDKPGTRARWSLLKEDKRIFLLDNRIRCKDGSYRSFRWTATPHLERKLIHASAQDVTDLKRMEKTVRESETALEALFNASPDGAFLMDANGRLIACNERLASRFGKRSIEVLGQSVYDLVPPDAVSHRKAIVNQVVSTKSQVRFEDRRSNRVYDHVVQPIVDADGCVTKVAVFTRDITEERTREDLLTESRERYRLLADHATDVIWTTDLNMRLTYVSPSIERLSGFTVEEAMTRTVLEALTPDSVAEVSRSLEESLERERRGVNPPDRTRTLEIELNRKDGGTVWTEAKFRFLRDGDGRPTGVLANVRDISERKLADEERRRLEAKIRQTQKLESLGVLAGGIAHDFNNILQVVLGYTELALGELPESPPDSSIKASLEAVKVASMRAAKICSQMLDYSGHGRYAFQAFDLLDVVHEVCGQLQISIPKKLILDVGGGSNLPAIKADPTQISQIIVNLVTNSAEAMDNGPGEILISTGVLDCDRSFLSSTWIDDQLPEGPYVYIEVADTGCGMDQDTLARLFDPFFSTKFTGRGLGLGTVLGIVRGHRGALTVKSEPGKGTTMRVLFPAAKTEDLAAARESAPAVVWNRGETILLVDDEPGVREVGQRALKGLGFTVLLAAGGREALQLLRTYAVSCVILDLTMPEMNGIETFAEIRKLDQDVPVILSSGYSGEAIAARFDIKGFAAFLSKPYKLQELEEKLADLWRRQHPTMTPTH